MRATVVLALVSAAMVSAMPAVEQRAVENSEAANFICDGLLDCAKAVAGDIPPCAKFVTDVIDSANSLVILTDGLACVQGLTPAISSPACTSCIKALGSLIPHN